MTERAALLIRRGAQIEALLPSDELLADHLRKAIRAPLRRTKSRTATLRTWLLDAACYDVLVAALKRDGLRVEVFGPAAEGARPSVASSDRATLGVTESAPWSVVEAAYRAMANLHHPDKIGSASTEVMKQINLAYERLEKLH